MTHRFRLSTLSILLLFLVSLAGCGDSVKPVKKDGTSAQELLPRTSPENVLFDLRLIYGVKDSLVTSAEDAHHWAEEYGKLFHPDFKFFFVPDDADPDSFPDYCWFKEDEVISFENVLLSIAGLPPEDLWPLDDIQLTWTYGASVPDTRIDPVTDELLHPGWQYIYVYGIFLYLVATNPEDYSYRVPSGTADFYFAPDPADSTLWVITEWRDKPFW